MKLVYVFVIVFLLSILSLVIVFVGWVEIVEFVCILIEKWDILVG